MILLTHETPILLCVDYSDFRKGIDGFVALCQHQLSQDPRSGTVYLFINRARTMIRALTYDGTGYWLMTKRISRGKFTGWPVAGGKVTRASAQELRVIMGGNPSSTPLSVNKNTLSAPPCTTLNVPYQSAAGQPLAL